MCPQTDRAGAVPLGRLGADRVLKPVNIEDLEQVRHGSVFRAARKGQAGVGNVAQSARENNKSHRTDVAR